MPQVTDPNDPNKKIFQPKIYNLRTTNIWKAFLLNSIVIAMVTALTIAINDVTPDSIPQGWKILINCLSAAAIAFVSYVTVRYLFNFGDGMLANSPRYRTFW